MIASYTSTALDVDRPCFSGRPLKKNVFFPYLAGVNLLLGMNTLRRECEPELKD